MGFMALSLILNTLDLGPRAGFFNGLSSSAGALGRAGAPLIVGTLWSYSIGRGAALPYPVDFHVAFYLIALLAAVCLLVSFAFRRQPPPTH